MFERIHIIESFYSKLKKEKINTCLFAYYCIYQSVFRIKVRRMWRWDSLGFPMLVYFLRFMMTAITSLFASTSSNCKYFEVVWSRKIRYFSLTCDYLSLFYLMNTKNGTRATIRAVLFLPYKELHESY